MKEADVLENALVRKNQHMLFARCRQVNKLLFVSIVDSMCMNREQVNGVVTVIVRTLLMS